MAEEEIKRLKMNFEYLSSYSGFCKVLVVVLNLLAFITASLSANNYATSSSYSTIFLFVSMLSFWISLFILGVYLFKINDKFDKISFNIFGFYYNFIICIAYFTSSIMVAILGGFYASATFFGLLSFSVYALDAYLYFCEINSKTPFWIVLTANQRDTNQNQSTNQPESGRK